MKEAGAPDDRPGENYATTLTTLHTKDTPDGHIPFQPLIVESNLSGDLACGLGSA